MLINRYKNSSKNWWKFDPKWLALNRVVKVETVLDVGCSYGDFGAKLIDKGCSVDGIEIYEPAFLEAQKILGKVYKIDLDSISDIESQIPKTYSLITFMDVLEHCKDPELVLIAFRDKLLDRGRLIVSLPNVLNINQRFQFLCGNFTYEEYGVLDRTHLRFYTMKTALQLIRSVYSDVRIVGYTPCNRYLNKFVKFWPALLALQFVIEAKK